ncbi:MAG: type IV pili methyl-accepting chemotaxis transducer N-terminal domain-containing protein [Pseudomonadota bacterium]
MDRAFKNSLLLRIGIAMTAITLLGFGAMLASIIISEATKGEAGAINQAGTLRMQSYRIAGRVVYQQDIDAGDYWQITRALVDEFEARVNDPRLTRLVPDSPDHELRQAYNRITRKWERVIKPLLNVYMSTIDPEHGAQEGLLDDDKRAWQAAQQNIRGRFPSIIDRFVADVDYLVVLLEEDTESKIRLLRAIQIVSLFLTLGVVFKTMLIMHHDVLTPLRELLDFAEHARLGDFSKKVKHHHDDELGQLGAAFNLMADDLSRIHTGLEERVREKTADLERSNRSLELLYNTTRRLNDIPFSATSYQKLLEDIEKQVGFGPAIICLTQPMSGHGITLASTRTSEDQLQGICSPEKCAACFEQEHTRIKEWQATGANREKAISIPIKELGDQYGVLLISLPTRNTPADWQLQLLEAVAKHIAIAIGTAYRISSARRLALYEERGVIARELHDSLAQALSYLKIQVSRLEKSLQQADNEQTIHGIVKEIRNGLNDAYQQLRGLLTTFRLGLDGQSLNQQLLETVKEFRERGSIDIQLDNQLHDLQLTANEDVHVLQIIREALSNIIRHSGCDTVLVSLRGSLAPESMIRVMIEDNGCGLPDSPERLNHYGLRIMEERARSLNTALTIQNPDSGGTRIIVEFASSNEPDSTNPPPYNHINLLES